MVPTQVALTYESRQEPSDPPVQFGPRPVQLERPHGPGEITTQDPAALKRSNSQHPAAYERSNSDQRNLADPVGDWENACWDLGDPTANFQEVQSSFVPPVPEDITPLPLAPVDALLSAPAGALALDNCLSSNMQAPDVAAHPEQHVTVGITTNHLDPGTASPGWPDILLVDSTLTGLPDLDMAGDNLMVVKGKSISDPPMEASSSAVRLENDAGIASDGVLTSADVDKFDFTVGNPMDRPPLLKFHELEDLRRFVQRWAVTHGYKLPTGNSGGNRNVYLRCSLAGEDSKKPQSDRQRMS
ncbi:hypothetical protein PGTUg99_035835 [Puccinia graminis f. sp. tritici]|uniref:Uncharacterized protein n=1 Tax=Puccinia graminis f. sp. tritici TaxID=56615 RepID=A0A5B0QW13_PUCGR|nr:hypothetical protein PGTUg99_035835 [Puccinia graminis f. sp. tritici]